MMFGIHLLPLQKKKIYIFKYLAIQIYVNRAKIAFSC